MANKNLLTTQAKTVQVEQVYYSPVAVLPSSNTSSFGTLYCFLSKVDPWSDDNDPPQPTGDMSYLKQVFKNMFAAKMIRTADISPVIQRINWSQGTVYDYYRDDVDMAEKDTNGNLVYEFYVKNKYDQVFKCLWNSNGTASTIEPYFEPGTYGSNGVFLGSDGYKWKFMYTIDTGLKVKFMDDTWIPIAIGPNVPNPLESTAGAGSIEAINITDGGTGYDPANASITITVTGDGTGSTGQAVVENGVITDIIIPTGGTGSDYTFANVSITSTRGSGAVAIAPPSPIGGHGFDPISELGCNKVMITCEFNGSESDVIPTDIDFHQIGLLHLPTTYSNIGLPANGSIYRTTTDIVVASGFGTYTQDEYVYQYDNDNNVTFSAKVLSFNTSTNVLYVINTVGTMSLNDPIFGNTSKTTRTLLSHTKSDFVPFSGYITYIENRSSIQRSEDGIEQFRFVLGY